MNFFQDLYTQGRTAFLAMPMPSRIIAGMLILVVAIGLALLVRTGNSSGGVYLFGGRLLTEEEITQFEGAFSLEQLRDYDIVGNRIRVPAARKDSYLRALANGGVLPSDLTSRSEVALSAMSPFESASQREQRMSISRQQEIRDQIMRLPFVRWASVTYDSRREGFAGNFQQSVSVMVTPASSEPLSLLEKKLVENHVANAWAGLKPENVHVTDTNAGNGLGDWVDTDDPHFKTKQYYDQLWERKIRQLLQPYGRIQLAVNVELDPKLHSNSTKVQFGEPATLEEDTSQYQSESSRPVDGGIPGVASNAYGNKPTSLSQDKTQTSKVVQTREQARREVGQEYSQTQMAGLVPQRVGVSIGIPSSYYRQVYVRRWMEANPDTSPDEMPPMSAADREKLLNETENQIRLAVATIIPPVPPGDDRMATVEVFDYADLPESPEVQPSIAENALGWLAESWTTLALVATALVALLIARSLVRSAPTGTDPEFAEGFGLEIPAVPQDELELSEEAEKRQARMMEITGGSLRDDLVDMVDTNPDAAANVLRAWIGEPA